MRWRTHLPLFIIVLTFATSGYGQNYQRFEEEEILDKERKRRVEEIIEDRKREAETIREKPLTDKEIEDRDLVEVEPNNVLPSDLTNIYSLVPYAVRRNRWGWYYGVTYSTYVPDQYESDYFDAELATFDELYDSPQTPLLEFFVTYKWNFSLGSLGADLAYGIYQNDASDEDLLGNAALDLQMLRVGARFTLDNLMFEPYLAPYALGGVYTVFYDETQGEASFNGTTSVAPYWGAGLLFQLNWLDPTAAVEAYVSGEIENTYVFIEGRQYLASSDANEPDFSSELDLAAGITLEF